MKILHFQYLHRTPTFDAANSPMQNAAFDFSLSHVLERLHEKRREQESGLHISASRRATFQITQQLIAWTERQDNSSETVAWHHPSRDWSLEEWQLQNRLWSQAMGAISSQNLQNPLPHFAHLEDDFFGQYLSDLIYAQEFLTCFCPACQTDYDAQNCRIDKWFAHSSGGEKLVCAQNHTLHSRETMEFFP